MEAKIALQHLIFIIKTSYTVLPNWTQVGLFDATKLADFVPKLKSSPK